jgi:hypothetical protein
LGYNPSVGKLLALVLVAALAGAAVAAYNAVVYEVVQPVPLSWNHSADELRLIGLERERQNLAARLGGNQRVGTLAGVPQIGAPDDSEKPPSLGSMERSRPSVPASRPRRAEAANDTADRGVVMLAPRWSRGSA